MRIFKKAAAAAMTRLSGSLTHSTISKLLFTLNNPNAYGTTEGDRFGTNVIASGKYVIATAIFEDSATGSDTGKAYIFSL